MWSSTLSPMAGRHLRYSASSGVVQAASSLITTAVFMWSWSTRRSFADAQTESAMLVDVR